MDAVLGGSRVVPFTSPGTQRLTKSWHFNTATFLLLWRVSLEQTTYCTATAVWRVRKLRLQMLRRERPSAIAGGGAEALRNEALPSLISSCALIVLWASDSWKPGQWGSVSQENQSPAKKLEQH